MSIFHLPDLGEGLAEATVVRWHVSAGDAVEADQLLVSVETDKAIVDIPSPQRGRIEALLASEGAVIPTHAPLVRFTATRDASPDDAGSVVGSLPVTAPHAGQESFIVGRHRHTEARLQQTRQRRAQRAGSVTPAAVFERWESLEPVRRAMAENMAAAHREIVPVTIFDEVCVAFTDRAGLLPRIVRAMVVAARAEPALNAWYDSTQQRRCLHDDVHIGIAMDTAHGLYVPVLKNAACLKSDDIARLIEALKVKAAERRLTSAMQAGATISLSNYGSLAGKFATPLMMPPQVAILGVGQWREVPLHEKNGGTIWQLALPLSLTVDHRVVTGGEAARFLAAVMADLAT